DCIHGQPCEAERHWTGGGVYTAGVSSDGRWLVNDDYGRAKLWDARQCLVGACHPIALVGGPDALGLAVQDTGDGAFVAGIGFDGDVSVVSRRDGRYRTMRHFSTPWSEPAGIAISPDATRVAAFGDRGVLVWDLTHCSSTTDCDVVLKTRVAD